MSDLRAWGVETHSVNRVDGDRRHLLWDHEPGESFHYRLFRTRRACRAAAMAVVPVPHPTSRTWAWP